MHPCDGEYPWEMDEGIMDEADAVMELHGGEVNPDEHEVHLELFADEGDLIEAEFHALPVEDRHSENEPIAQEPVFNSPNRPSLPLEVDSPLSSGSSSRPYVRVKGKQGGGMRNRLEREANDLKNLPVYRRFQRLSIADKKKARHRLRTVLFRRMKTLKQNKRVQLDSGRELVIESDAEFGTSESQAHIRRTLLYDVATTYTSCQQTAGAAAEKWLLNESDDGLDENVTKIGRPKHNHEQEMEKVLPQCVLLLTWHGDFGVRGVNMGAMIGHGIDEVAARLSRMPSVQESWQKVLAHMGGLLSHRRLYGLALSLELCGETWTQREEVRLHLHAWIMQGQGQARLKNRDLKLDCCANPFFSVYGQEQRKGMAVHAGCFYVTVKKIGQVCSWSNKKPHVDFMVKGDWVLRLYAAHKIEYDTAVEHIVKGVANCKQLLADLQHSREHVSLMHAEQEMERIMRQIQRESKPWRRVPEVDSWTEQYNDERPLDRYKFLVLEGPSRVGKTRFVQGALVNNPSEALILDCADAVVPPLRGNFDRSIHKVIMFDEAHAEMVIRCKKLFQASVNKTTFGSSATNAYVHTVWVHGIKMVIGSNVWKDEVDVLPRKDRDWLAQNSVHVFVDSPLWVQ